MAEMCNASFEVFNANFDTDLAPRHPRVRVKCCDCGGSVGAIIVRPGVLRINWHEKEGANGVKEQAKTAGSADLPVLGLMLLFLVVVIMALAFGCSRKHDQYRLCRGLGHGAVYCLLAAIE